ncbi:hypothetical protein LCGC14_1495590 [marine sediment metagenome]|uniref:ATPase AAA-type core domain-containing protein n=1 Tax=marine sediment metagenome TaxID=412755 RepID=A0A0F9J642_9ZZZZ
MDDMQILKKAHERENDSRDRRPVNVRSWTQRMVGATRGDITRLVDEGYIRQFYKNPGYDILYMLTDKGKNAVLIPALEAEVLKVRAEDILEAMEIIVGFDDVKQAIAGAIGSGRRLNFLLEGPPACAKSMILAGVRSAVPAAFEAFGSRTSAAGLSEMLFDKKPPILLIDEVDKMRADAYSVLLGLMESGEILETKSGKTRGIQLETIVIAACNSTRKMSPEFLSRFALRVAFKAYTRPEFIDVCRGFLRRSENCPDEIAAMIGAGVFDHALGDVRKAKGVWALMNEPTPDEVHRVIQFMRKYNPANNARSSDPVGTERMPGL